MFDGVSAMLYPGFCTFKVSKAIRTWSIEASVEVCQSGGQGWLLDGAIQCQLEDDPLQPHAIHPHYNRGPHSSYHHYHHGSVQYWGREALFSSLLTGFVFGVIVCSCCVACCLVTD